MKKKDKLNDTIWVIQLKTVKKDGKTFHIHIPYIKNNNGELAPINKEWTVESDDPKRDDVRGYKDLESIFREI